MVNAYPPLIDALRDPARYPHPVKRVVVLETHISWVLLAGRYAYKIKKPVNLGFLDFSQLEQRAFFCREEIRLNRRLAPQIYLDAVAIGGSRHRPEFGATPAIEYAVKMRRFGADKLLDHLLIKNRLESRHIDQLAETIAGFHQSLTAAPPDSDYGTSQAIHAPARQNFRQLAPLLGAQDQDILKSLQHKFERAYGACESLLTQRRQDGFIREGHGDLHLGNICLLRDRPVAFDGIEFAPELRWIDVINDAGFLIMDLIHHGRADLAYRFLNAYLEHTGDYGGLDVLRLYISYRAAVRAKIAGFRMAQNPDEAARQEILSYLKLADRSLNWQQPTLIICHGLPGCGKSVISQRLLERYGLIRLRSDVERKRLFGLSGRQQSGSAIDSGIYTPQASQQTYRHLLKTARALLENGFAVIIDATFLKYQQRQPFQRLAKEIHAGFAILSIQAEQALLRQRLQQRRQAGGDVSEANLAVLDKAIAQMETLQTDELGNALVLDNNSDGLDDGEQQAVWSELGRLLKPM